MREKQLTTRLRNYQKWSRDLVLESASVLEDMKEKVHDLEVDCRYMEADDLKRGQKRVLQEEWKQKLRSCQTTIRDLEFRALVVEALLKVLEKLDDSAQKRDLRSRHSPVPGNKTAPVPVGPVPPVGAGDQLDSDTGGSPVDHRL